MGEGGRAVFLGASQKCHRTGRDIGLRSHHCNVAVRKVNGILLGEILVLLYKALVRPHLEYYNILEQKSYKQWHNWGRRGGLQGQPLQVLTWGPGDRKKAATLTWQLLYLCS